jgi:SAM-dependent methyltransferase
LDPHSSSSSSRITLRQSRFAVGDYELLAAEYYDAVRHPTCANFREASRQLLTSWFARFPQQEMVLCEVGAGKSLLAEILAPRLRSMGRVFLVDASPSMLAFSHEWLARGASLVLADAVCMPMRSASIDIFVACLGDPYNTESFWSEVQRLLRPGGLVFFTTPSYEWASGFRTRPGDEIHLADFELSDGRVVSVPSYILPIDRQLALMKRHGLNIDNVVERRLSDLSGAIISPKLLHYGQSLSVVTGYALTFS